MKKLIIALSIIFSTTAAAGTCGPSVSADAPCSTMTDNQIQSERIVHPASMNQDDDTTSVRFTMANSALTHEKMMEPNENR
ncbi:hypothetical protein [Vibrio tapetis]|uniref:Lipoprotein n=1 Tax=Vibrio tapetis subsp. tapetis TaxID=1671868 RepID=A0A2N8ZKE9_9VIBR|nr:hypothetical protein [Vibrio tapetis]SON52385.1 exported protein of unknown function [Vibrio tapetis subsp. tapetis]